MKSIGKNNENGRRLFLGITFTVSLNLRYITPDGYIPRLEIIMKWFWISDLLRELTDNFQDSLSSF